MKTTETKLGLPARLAANQLAKPAGTIDGTKEAATLRTLASNLSKSSLALSHFKVPGDVNLGALTDRMADTLTQIARLIDGQRVSRRTGRPIRTRKAKLGLKLAV